MASHTIAADASALAAAVEECGRLLGDSRDLHPYFHATLPPLLADMSRVAECHYERGRLVLRPSPEMLAALASLRAARGKRPPVAWNPPQPESA